MTSWFVYLIAYDLLDERLDRRVVRTYVGSTTDVTRRVRQHNREIRGGARSTEAHAGKWRLMAVVGGFATRSDACRWEALVKKRARGLENRLAAMNMICVGICPAPRRTNGRMYEVPEGLIGYSIGI